MVVAIDHHAAHVYQGFNASRPEDEKTERPYDPFGFHHYPIHKKEAHYKGERVLEEATFYEEVAKELLPADEIVLIGHGAGKSSSVEYLAEYLKKHHHSISQHVIATETADLSAHLACRVVGHSESIGSSRWCLCPKAHRIGFSDGH